ncbi:unnamed protein product [Pleuronectes platessa]|uniref:Uncharacterized protein n=1 Tax=Pleuronectes platessa TaxID=8262 RepID=A0A9N7YZU8_PLEPL|nr:unnamed protein product [Pleuronectes platessa]
MSRRERYTRPGGGGKNSGLTLQHGGCRVNDRPGSAHMAADALDWLTQSEVSSPPGSRSSQRVSSGSTSQPGGASGASRQQHPATQRYTHPPSAAAPTHPPPLHPPGPLKLTEAKVSI